MKWDAIRVRSAVIIGLIAFLFAALVWQRFAVRLREDALRNSAHPSTVASASAVRKVVEAVENTDPVSLGSVCENCFYSSTRLTPECPFTPQKKGSVRAWKQWNQISPGAGDIVGLSEKFNGKRRRSGLRCLQAPPRLTGTFACPRFSRADSVRG